MHPPIYSVPEISETAVLDLVWGAGNIAKVIGRSERQAKHMLAKGEIPGRKTGGRWVASRVKLREHFEGGQRIA